MASGSRGPVAAAVAGAEAAGAAQGFAAVGVERALAGAVHGDSAGAGQGLASIDAVRALAEAVPGDTAGAAQGFSAVGVERALAEALHGDTAGAGTSGHLQTVEVTQRDAEATHHGGEGPNEAVEKIGEAPNAEQLEKAKATTSDSRVDKGKGPAIVDAPRVERAGPVLWLGTGNLNRRNAPSRAPTPDDYDDKLIIILRDSGRVSEMELLKYNVVPDEILANRSPSAQAAIRHLFRFLHESTVQRRKMLHLLLKGLSQGYSEGNKWLRELRDEISATQEEIKKMCGKVLRKTPAYLMSDPVLLPK